MILNQPKPSIDRICSRTTTGLAWIEPNGTVHWLNPRNTHGQWAYFYERPERDDGTWAPVEDTMTYNRLLDEGWIRVSNVLNLTVKDLDDIKPAAWDAWALIFSECKKSTGFGPESSYVAISSGRGGMHFTEVTAADIVENFCSRRGKDAFWSSMMSESMVRRLVREMLLQESESPTARAASLGMAVMKTVTPINGNDCIIVYSPALLTACLERAKDGKVRLGRALWDTLQAKDPVVKSGIVTVASRARQCNERPQVSAAASAPGSGMGPSAYEAAMWYAGGLHSDRKETSSSAGSVWSKYRGRSIDGDVEALPMDDISDPKTPQVEDDCEMQDREWLNYTYRLRSKPPGLDELERNHGAMISSLAGYGFSPEEIEKELHALFLTMFKRRMGFIR